jgi:hypothetical protein
MRADSRCIKARKEAAMRWAGLVIAVILLLAGPALAAELGSFDNSRLGNPAYNILSGSAMDSARLVLTEAGVNITLTSTVTPAFLETVDIFFTSKISTAIPSAAEVQALADWVEDGGVLIVTGVCT